MTTTTTTTTETDLATHPFYDAVTNRIATEGELRAAARADRLDTANFPNITAEALATVKDRWGWSPLHSAKNLHLIPGATAEFLASVKDNYGVTPLHRAFNLPACAFSLHLIPGVTATSISTVKDNDGWTLLHDAAQYNFLHLIPGVTAEFLATVKTNNGETPLHIAARNNRLHSITGVTMELVEKLGLLDDAMEPQNIGCLADDLRANGARYNKPCQVRKALLKAARSLRAIDTNIRAALSAALEGGFQLPVKSLARLM